MGNTPSNETDYIQYNALFARSQSDSEMEANPNKNHAYDHYDTQKKLVYAYINQTFTNVKIYDFIPNIIYYVCFTYYLVQFDKWNAKYYNKFVVLSSSAADKIYDIFTIQSERWKTMYGSIMVDSTKYSNGIYEWRLKIIKMQNAAVIGLSSMTGKVDDCFWMKPNQKYYAWNTENTTNKGFISHNKQCVQYQKSKFEGNDIIEIHLNISNKTLAFYQNHESVHSFVNIDLSVFYWLAVSCNNNNDSVQIMDFNINQMSKMNELQFDKFQ